MSSEHLASAETELKGELGAAWDILKGASANYTDLGVARRFGGSSAAYSLRDIGAMNGSVVRVRREPYDTSTTEIQDEEDFSANQVSSGVLEDWVNGKLEDTLPADVNYVVGLESARYFNGTNSGVVTSSISGLVNATGSIETSFALFAKNEVIVSFEDNSDVDDNLTIQTDSSGFLTILHRTNGTINILGKLQTLVLDDGTLHTVRWNMSSSGSQVILDGKDITSAITFTVGNASTVKWVSDLNAPDVFSIGYRAESSPDGFATGVVVNTTIFGTDNTTPLANYLGYGSSNYWNDTIGSLNATESNITQTWEQAQGAAAAYSLRKVKASYSGDAVRIRRSSDDVEVDVAFDSDNKVSASSAITNIAEQGGEIGSTTATDLNGFLNETLTVGTAVNGTSPYGNYDFEANSNTGFDADNSAGGTGSAGFPYSFASGDVMIIRYTVSNFDSTSSLSPAVRGTTGTNSVAAAAGGGTTFTANGTYTDTLTATADGTHLMFADGNTGSYTISDFQIVSHTHQAFVHTWYDQAGSNNAVQETDANQPKIAESGALLDGIKFSSASDGTSANHLDIAAKLMDSTDGFMSSVINSVQDMNQLGVIYGNRNNNSGFVFGIHQAEYPQVFYRQSSGANRLENSDFTLSSSSKYLLSVDKDGTNDANLFGNAVSRDTDSSMNYITSTGSASKIGQGGNTVTSDANGLNANINELIFYNSDQAANRFKIESNINNYYGLYNDEYEWDDAVNTEWQNNVTDGTTTFTANGKDGFTITATGENKSSFKYKITSPSTASNDYYKVSFNVDDPDGLFTSAFLRLTATGAGATSQAITNGFNSMSLRTGASFEYMSINSDASGSSKTATLSDFKISLIARNGFVETLYDQSTNGNDVDQGTAGSQPAIVQNGGQVKVGNRASIKFDGSNDFLERATYTQGELAQINTIFSVAKLDTYADENRKVYDGHASTARNMLQLNPVGNGQFAHYAGVVAATGEDADANQHLFTSRLNGTASRFYIDGVQKSTSNTGSFGMQGITIGANHDQTTNNCWDGDIQEIIVYNSDQNDDRANQQDDINNYYTIY